MTLPKRILVPVDFSTASDTALDFAIVLAKQSGEASVVLLHVWDPPVDELAAAGRSGEVDSLALFSATPRGACMREYLARLEREGIAARGCLEFGDPARAINRTATDGAYDVVVIGAHEASSRSWRSMAFHVTERVVRDARCPVLALHRARPIIPQFDHASRQLNSGSMGVSPRPSVSRI